MGFNRVYSVTPEKTTQDYTNTLLGTLWKQMFYVKVTDNVLSPFDGLSATGAEVQEDLDNQQSATFIAAHDIDFDVKIEAKVTIGGTVFAKVTNECGATASRTNTIKSRVIVRKVVGGTETDLGTGDAPERTAASGVAITKDNQFLNFDMTSATFNAGDTLRVTVQLLWKNDGDGTSNDIQMYHSSTDQYVQVPMVSLERY